MWNVLASSSVSACDRDEKVVFKHTSSPWCLQVILKGDTKKLSLHGVRRLISRHTLWEGVMELRLFLLCACCGLQGGLTVSRCALLRSPQQTCAVCLEDFKVKDELGVLPCQHAFHRK